MKKAQGSALVAPKDQERANDRVVKPLRVSNQMRPYVKRMRLGTKDLDLSDPATASQFERNRQEMKRILVAAKILGAEIEHVIEQTLDAAVDHRLQGMRKEDRRQDRLRSKDDVERLIERLTEPTRAARGGRTLISSENFASRNQIGPDAAAMMIENRWRSMLGPKPRLHLPFAEWPEIDKRMWRSAVANDDPFDDGPGARLAKATLHKYWMGWRRFLGFLLLTESDILDATPSVRLTRERVRRFAEHLAQTNTPHSVAIQMDSLYGAARTMMPKTSWVWLRDIKTRLYSAAPRGTSSRPVITSVQLADLGIALMEESNIAADKPIKMVDAVRYRDGFIIALWGYVPLRHKNFAAIEIDRDLIKEDSNWSIVIPPEETKTKTYIEFAIPEELRERLSTYLNYVRPRMLRRSGCKALWVSAKGGPLSYSAFGLVMTRHTTERLGIRVTPHDARDAAATTWAIAAPHQIGIARDLLAHADLRTTTKYYNRAKGVEASRIHNQLIARLRKRSDRNRP